MSLAEVVAEARARGDYTPLLRALPFTRFLAARAQLDGEHVRVELPYRHALLGNESLPAYHGGVVGALLETAALLQLIHERGWPLPRTVDFTVDYLRGAGAQALYAVADVQRRGRRIANVRMRAYQADAARPVALGRGNFLLP